VAGNEYWKAKQVDGGNATFDEDRAAAARQIGAEGWETELILTTRGIRRRYVNTLKAQKRWNDANAGTMHGGFKYIDYNGFPLVFDDDCPKQHMFFIRPDDFMWVNLNGNDFRWMNRDGAILRKVENPDQDAYKATLYKYCDLGSSAEDAGRHLQPGRRHSVGPTRTPSSITSLRTSPQPRFVVRRMSTGCGAIACTSFRLPVLI
jgi:hypothetical protein